MERTVIRLGGVDLSSSVMNASGPHSAEKGEIMELAARHRGAVVFKSCNRYGLDKPDNLKNRGADYFADLAGDLVPRGKAIVASVVGETEDEIVQVATILDLAGVKIIELNLADDFVQNSAAPFASLERLKAVVGRTRGEVAAKLAVKVPPKLPFEPRAVADLFKSLRVDIVLCANDLPKDLEVDLKTGAAKGAERALSQVHAFYRAAEGLLDIVAVGGINTGRDAYIAHLTGAKAVQVGSALIKEGAGALGRIDGELDDLLGVNGHASVNAIIGQIRFAG
jgi:dihydroorotate dehydrogenase (NAD+) catalytic subunit